VTVQENSLLTHVTVQYNHSQSVQYQFLAAQYAKAKMSKVYLLDYVAGNVRSLVNAIEKVGYTVEWIRSPEDVEKADVSVLYQLVF